MKSLEFLFDDPGQWCQGITHHTTVRGELQSCLIGRVGDMLPLDAFARAESAIAKAATELFPDRACRLNSNADVIISFNDDSNTTFADVQKVLQRASELMREPKPVAP